MRNFFRKVMPEPMFWLFFCSRNIGWRDWYEREFLVPDDDLDVLEVEEIVERKTGSGPLDLNADWAAFKKGGKS